MIFFAGNRPATVIATISVYKHLQHTLRPIPCIEERMAQAQTIPSQNCPPLSSLQIIPTNNTLYLFLYFPMNCFCNFFLRSAISFSSFTSGTGRKSQIRSFTTTISVAEFRKLPMIICLLLALFQLRTQWNALCVALTFDGCIP